MTIKVTCQCGKRFAAPLKFAGKRAKCPACGWTIEIPATKAAQKATEQIRCKFCHEYIPRSRYDEHIQRHMALLEDGQHTDYATLPPDERAPSEECVNAPRWYRHQKCGEVTGMPDEIIATYLSNPWFYLSNRTFCHGCGKHVRFKQCIWEETGEDIYTYMTRLRAAKPELRPALPLRMLAAVVNAVRPG